MSLTEDDNACHWREIELSIITQYYLKFMALVEGTEQLEGDPLLLDRVEERPRADAVV